MNQENEHHYVLLWLLSDTGNEYVSTALSRVMRREIQLIRNMPRNSFSIAECLLAAAQHMMVS